MPDTYLCPGESQPIGRAIHLARLANFYAPCVACSQRHDTGLLPLATRKQLEQRETLPSGTPEFHAEGVQGVFHNQLTVAAARRLAAAFGIVLRQQLQAAEQMSREPVVVLAGDGRPITAEFLAAASDGLRYCGCRVLEISSATSGMLAFALRQQAVDGGLLLGNPADRSHCVGVKFWGAGGLPWSRGPELIAIERLLQAPINRPTRTSGSASRWVIEPDYLRSLEGYFHALRPLRLVLDTTSTTLKRWLRHLVARVACTVVDDDDPLGIAAQVASGGRPEQAPPIRQKPGLPRLLPQPPQALGRRVLATGADFGVWTDGDGEAVALVDERGCEVAYERLLVVLARHLQMEKPGGAVIIEPVNAEPIAPGARGRAESSMAGDRLLGMVEHSRFAADATRRAMAAAMAESRAVLGGGASGRYWLPPSPAPDALHLIAVLLTILSTRDWRLSEVVARCLEPAEACR